MTAPRTATSSSRVVRHRTSRGIVYERRGDGPPVVLIHGWCLNASMWSYLQAELMGDYDVVSVDLAGFGASSDLDGPYSLPRYADDVDALVSELELHAPVLIGFAFGAAVALECAGRSGSRVKGVISVAVPESAGMPYDRMPRAMQRDFPEFARRSAEALFHAEHSDAEKAWLARMFASAPLPVALATVSVLASYDPLPAVAKVQAPVLFMHADKDTVAPVALGERCRAAAPRGQLGVIPDCGHLIVLDRKAAFHEAVRSYLSSLHGE